jgi:hypothetical protein
MGALVLAVAALTYGVVVAFPIEMPSGRSVVPLAALGPALVALGPHGYGVAPMAAIVAATIPAGIVALAARRRPVAVDAFRHAVLLGCCASVFAAVSRLSAGPLSGNRLLAAIGICSLPFLLGDAAGHVASASAWYRVRLRQVGKEVWASLPQHLVFVSTAGLVGLAFADLGAIAFVIVLLPLAATRIGFARFAAARRTYAQTVRALGKLTESAGYVPEGHHARVAELCVAIGVELGMWGEPLRMLELTALLHDVGTVAVPEPSAMAVADRAAVGRTGAEILEATGYLAKQAPIVAAHAASAEDPTTIEARILRVASAYDDLAATSADPVGELAARVAPGDRDAYEALQRVLARS